MAKDTKQYGNSSEAVGRTPAIDKHPGPNPAGTADEKFSQMAKTDAHDHILKSVKNLSVQAKHQKEMPITDRQAYKRQSHAVKPSGPIQSFVGNRLDTSPNKELPTKRPSGKEAEYMSENEDKDNKG